jgi:tetratricopeptide (TPR) repeat protein
MLTIVLILAALAPKGADAEARDRAEAYYHYSLAQQARLTGDTDGALVEYRRAQKLDPSSGAIRLEQAKLLREAGRLAEAVSTAEEAVRSAAGEPEAHRTLAELYQLQAETTSDEAPLKRATAEYEEVVRLDPRDAGTLEALAKLYGVVQDHKGAVGAWQRYLAVDPGSFDAHLQLGAQYLASGDSEHAAQALKEALELRPSSSPAYASLGDVYARAQQADQAILHYRKALEIDPTSLPVHINLGEVLFRAERHKEAVAEADTVLAADPKNRYALDLKGRALRELKQYEAALETADRLLAVDPLSGSYLKVTIAEARRDYATAAAVLEAILARAGNPDAEDNGNRRRLFLVHLGYAYEQLNRPADAADAFARAKAVGGEPDAALLGYEVEALLQAKNRDKALTAVRAARARFAEDPDLAALEATILREQGDERGALEILEKLRQKHPQDAKVLADVADFYQKTKKYPEAEGILRKALEAEPKSLRLLFQLGAALERQKRRDDAEAVFREALKIQPDSAPVLNYLGYMNADRGVRLEEALALIEKAVAIDPENSAYQDSLGWALYRLNRLDQAEEHLRKALVAQATSAVILDHLADILKRRGAFQEAVVFWQKALQGEDEEGELDHALVERKIREEQRSLDAHQKNP